MMHMTFYLGTHVTLWFSSWRVTGWLGYSFTLVAVLVLSVFHEWLAAYRATLMKNNKKTKRSTSPTSVIATTNTITITTDRLLAINVAENLMDSTLFGINVGAGYLLMMAVMTFNVGVFLTVLVGLSLGFFIFHSSSRADMCRA